jgi:hypothetical protein
MNRKDAVLKQYVDLTKKLGKFPSWKDCRVYGISPKAVELHWENMTKIRAEAARLYPSLEKQIAPQPLSHVDVANLRLNQIVSGTKKDNQKTLKVVNVLDYIETFAERVFEGKVSKVARPVKKKIKRVHTLNLSDLHFGADIEKEETGVLDYGPIQEARRFAAVIKQASEYKPQYRKETRLVIVLNGDIIENQMHDSRTGDVISMQCVRAIHLLTQGIAYLASHYAEVDVHCATGNHDRITSRHKERAVHQKFDSYATIIYYAVKSALNNISHVKVHIPKTPLSSYEVFGQKIAYTHSDTVVGNGGIYSRVDVKKIEDKINKINAALKDSDEYAAMLIGHTHVGHVIHMSNGCVLIGNGGLPPPDPFAVSLGNFESNSGQWIFESVPNHPVGDMRYIKVDKAIDNDASLDKIIKPFKEL